MIPLIFSLVQYEFGIKMVKLFKNIYAKNWQKEAILFDEKIK
jgi:hypothetical protein